MSDKYAAEALFAKRVQAGDPAAWAETTAKVMRAIGTWKANNSIDHEDIVNFAIFKAANTYQPKRKFVNHAIHIARNMLAQAFRYNRTRADVCYCSTEAIPDTPLDTPDVLDTMIARDDAILLLQAGTNSYVMSQLILAGKTRAQAAKVMGIDRYQSHAIIVKMRELLACEGE